MDLALIGYDVLANCCRKGALLQLPESRDSLLLVCLVGGFVQKKRGRGCVGWVAVVSCLQM